MVRRIYTKAPITEAVIEIRVPTETDTRIELLRLVGEKLAPRFGGASDVILREFKLQLGPKPVAESGSEDHGLRLVGEDPADLVQLLPGKIVVSRLAPYRNWEPLLENAKFIWGEFSKIIAPTRATRMAVRYINRFDLPGPSVQLRDFFSVYPQLPEIPAFSGVGGMLLQLQLPQPSLGGVLVLNQALVPPVVPGSVAIVLDMDLFSELGWDVGSEDLWQFAEKLHTAKNDIFESIISEKTRGLIE